MIKPKLFKKTAFLILATAAYGSTCYGVGSDQYANSVINFSSQWSTSSWSAQQAVGVPNVTIYGDNSNAWLASVRDGTLEYISLGFAAPVYAYGATIRETSGSGMVYKVEARDIGGIWHTVWQGKDPSKEGAIANFFVKWPITTYKVNGIKVHTNTSATTTWEEIDSVQLSGVTTNTTPAVSLVAADTVGSETLSSTGLFIVSRSLTANTAPLTVQYNITGTAINGTDYNSATALTGQVTIPAGVNKVGLFIKPVDDVLKENNESVTLTLVPNANYQVMTKFATGTVIINSDE
ncbi:MAG: hypothetical protein IPN42_04140 [Methylococcaceae bacterium]|nr:hypothetical protein [Methylococcaceae bacterium]